MTKNIILIIIVLIIIAGGAWWLFTSEENKNSNPVINKNQPAPNQDEQITTRTIKEFALEASNFKYSLVEMRVKQGEIVRVTLINREGFHDFVIDELNASTKQIRAGEQETIEFTASQKGQFEYYCSVGSHRQLGMKGNMIVE